MKRSEILRRCREQHWLEGTEGRSASGGLLASLTDESLIYLAGRLGVDVEDDDPKLPEKLEAFQGGSTLNGYRLAGEGWDLEARDNSGLGPGRVRCRALLEALIDAYNNRPRWRTGTPMESGRYLVFDFNGDVYADRWDEPGCCWSSRYGVGYYTHWMTLPDTKETK